MEAEQTDEHTADRYAPHQQRPPGNPPAQTGKDTRGPAGGCKVAAPLHLSPQATPGPRRQQAQHRGKKRQRDDHCRQNPDRGKQAEVADGHHGRGQKRQKAGRGRQGRKHHRLPHFPHGRHDGCVCVRFGLTEDFVVVAAENMNAVGHANRHQRDRHHGRDEIHGYLDPGHQAHAPDDGDDHHGERQEDAAQTAIGQIQRAEDNAQDQRHEEFHVAPGVLGEGHLHSAAAGDMELLGHAGRLFFPNQVTDGFVDRRPPGDPLKRPLGRFHPGHDEQTGAVARHHPVHKHGVIKQGVLQRGQGFGRARRLFHERINRHAIAGTGDIIHGGNAGHVFIPDGFDTGQERNFLGELFDNAQGARIEDPVFLRVIVQDTDNNEVQHTKALLHHVVVVQDRVIGGDHGFGVALEAQVLELHGRGQRYPQNRGNDQKTKTDDRTKNRLHAVFLYARRACYEFLAVRVV